MMGVARRLGKNEPHRQCISIRRERKKFSKILSADVVDDRRLERKKIHFFNFLLICAHLRSSALICEICG
jgi:Mg2+/citrate symporter